LIRKYRLVSCALLVLLLAGCSGYKEFYRRAEWATPEVVAARRVSPPPANPIVERAQSGNIQATVDGYLKRGYVPIGDAFFNSGRRESDDSAVQHGKDVGADLVLILNPKYTGSVTSSVPITTPTTTTSFSTGSATAYGPGGPVTAFGSGTTTTYGTSTTYVPITHHRSDYGAIFFIKQRFILGTFMRDLKDSERQELQSNKGVAVRLVAEGTPAFDADILIDDVITAIDGVSVSSPKAFSDVLRDRRGKQVSLSIVRRGQRLEKAVQLNP